MAEFLFIISCLAVVVGILAFIFGLIEGEVGLIGFGVVAGLLGLLFAFAIYTSDGERALDKLPVDRYGIVTEVSSDSVEIDDEDNFYTKQVVTNKYGASLEGIKIGDLVKLTYVEGAVHDYIAKVVPVTVTENGGK